MTPELSKLTKLSAIHLSGPMSDYEVIGTFTAPDLRQLVLYFDNTNGDLDQQLPDPVLPLFNTGSLTSLTKLEIDSFAHFRQVDALPWCLAIDTESAFNWWFEHIYRPLLNHSRGRKKLEAHISIRQ